LSRRLLALGVLAVLLCAPLACGPSSEEKAEAGALSRAIDLLRKAPNEAKAPLLRALAATRSTRPELQTVHDRCVDAYGLHVHGVELGLEAKAKLAAGADAATVGALLASAEDELGRARPLIERCTDQQAELKRRYRLQ
jgi:hypothetical protein